MDTWIFFLGGGEVVFGKYFNFHIGRCLGSYEDQQIQKRGVGIFRVSSWVQKRLNLKLKCNWKQLRKRFLFLLKEF